MTRRLGLLAAALVVALLGTTAVFSYVSKVEANAVNGAEMVDVLMATLTIPQGTTPKGAIDGKLVQLTSIPRKSVPEGALTTLEQVDASQTTVNEIFAGEVLLRAKFADQQARTGALLIPKDKIALSVQLGDPQRVAGFVVPGSEVAVFVTVEKPPPGAGQGEQGSYTSLLLSRISVIAVGPSTLKTVAPEGAAPANAEAVPSAILTLALTQDESERLVHATSTGALYFGLLSTTSKTAPAPGITDVTLLAPSQP